MTFLSPPLDTDTRPLTCSIELVAIGKSPSSAAILSIARQVLADFYLPLLSGALVALSFMSPPAGTLAWVALVPFAAALMRPRGTVELYLGAYMGGALVHLHVLDFIRTRVGNSAGLFGSHDVDWLVNGLAWAAFWPLTLYVGRRFVRTTGLSMFCALPIIWVASEFLRQEAGWIVLKVPFPWVQIGTTQAPYPRLIQIADLAGVWAVAAVIAAVNGALFDALSARRLKPLGPALVLLTATLLYGEYRLRQTQTTSGPTVALVSPSMKLDAVRQSPPKTDVLLWSETTYAGNLSDPSGAGIGELASASKTSGATLIVGCTRRQDGLHFNSAVVVDPREGYLGCYDKNFLVPWSEFQPWRLPGTEPERGSFTPGTSRPVFSVADFTCGVSICYDACFDRSSRGYSPQPDFFVACSRESSDMTGYIRRAMLDMTRFRAVESRRAFVRNVEDGFSGIVSSTGEFTPAPEPPWAQPVSVGHIPIDHRTTLYHWAGNWLPILCVGILGLGLFRPRRRK
jgi:apolipoprotein N-acyltransferase